MLSVRHAASTRQQHGGQHCKQSCSMKAVPSPDVQCCDLGHQHSMHLSALPAEKGCSAVPTAQLHPEAMGALQHQPCSVPTHRPVVPRATSSSERNRGAQCSVPKPPDWFSESLQHRERPAFTNRSGFQSTACIEMLTKLRNNPSTRPTQQLCCLHLF